MKIIDRYIDHMCEEVEGAMDYAEKYIEYKAKGEMSKASRFREMANDEIGHGNSIRDMAIDDIKKISEVTQLPAAEEEKWDAALKRYSEKTALVKVMLS